MVYQECIAKRLNIQVRSQSSSSVSINKPKIIKKVKKAVKKAAKN